METIKLEEINTGNLGINNTESGIVFFSLTLTGVIVKV